jgi:hypothetical protein
MKVSLITRKKQAFTRVHTSTVVLSPDPLSAILSTSVVRLLENKAEGPDDPEPTAKGHIHMEYSFH